MRSSPTERVQRSVRRLEGRLDQVHGRAADEAADEEVDGSVVELLRRRDLLQLPLAHDGDAIAHRHRLDLVVRDVDRRDAEVVLDARDLRARLHAQLRVEVRERLVHEESLRAPHDRAPHGDALALTAGQRARLSLQVRLEPEDARRLLHARVDLGLLLLAKLEPEGDVVVDREMRIERVALEDHRDVAVAGGHVVHDAVADAQDPLADLLEPGHHPEGGRLAAPRRPDENHELAVFDAEAHIRDSTSAVWIDLGDAVELHPRH